MNILGILGSILGVSKGYFENKAKLKRLKQEQEHSIVEAQTKAAVDRTLSNTDSDNQIDLITTQDKKYTIKDEVVTYLFLVPVFIATTSPFIIGYNNSDFTCLAEDITASYQSLDSLPEWYRYVLGAIIIDVLGFRSFARKIVDRFVK